MTPRMLLATTALCLASLSACATSQTQRPEPVTPLRGPQEAVVETDYSAALLCLGRYVGAQPFPAPRIAIGHISDMTGATDYFNGARVTQGASLMAMTALADAGVRVVERFDMGVIQAEMNYAQTGLVRDSDTQLRELSPGMLQGVDLYIVGGLTEFNPNIRSRGSDLYGADERATGAAASIGLNTQTIDVAMDLRLVDATSSEVLAVRALRKQIIGREIELGVFEFMSGGVVDIAAGQRALEPVQTAVRTMIDRAIFEFVGSLYNLPAHVCLDGREAPVQSAPTPARGRLIEPQNQPSQTMPSETPQAPNHRPAQQAPNAMRGPAAANEVGMHLGSFRTEGHAQLRWHELQMRHPEALEDLQQLVVPAQITGQGQVYGLLAGPFYSMESAERRCEELNARSQYCRATRLTP
ncbi:MAG: SPOR domain-containing protein [Alphaproteobacteria bacterium]|nr:SPOR domain-containing protein [Alphaproteobacteria bacterium]